LWNHKCIQSSLSSEIVNRTNPNELGFASVSDSHLTIQSRKNFIGNFYNYHRLGFPAFFDLKIARCWPSYERSKESRIQRRNNKEDLYVNIVWNRGGRACVDFAEGRK
jgi:hypothetical protein